MKEIASVVHFSAHLTMEEIQAILEDLTNQGIVYTHDTREYDSSHGEPVWYIP